MRVLVKYFFWLLSFFSLMIYYLLGTSLGPVTLGYLVENYYSEKMDNKLEIGSLNIENYPYIVAKININNGAVLSLKGHYDKEHMDIRYHLKGDTFTWNEYHLKSPIEVNGTFTGKFSELLIRGQGEIFKGHTEYSLLRKESHLKDIKTSFTTVNAKEVVDFFNYDLVIEGDMDIELDFEHYTSYKKNGLAKISMQKATMPNLLGEIEFTVNAEIIVKNLLYEYLGEIDSDIGKLGVINGHYNKAAGLLIADYDLYIKELSDFEKLLEHKYYGELNTAGSLKYESEKLSLKGNTNSYGGLLKYKYQHDYLDLDFKGVSLEKVLRQLSFPPLLSAKIYGSASYDIKDEIILVNTQLKETRFRRTKMTDRIYKVAGIDIRKDVYDDSFFTAAYQSSVLTSLLKIDNGINHLYLKDTRMNSKTNKITAEFEVQIDGEEFVGDIYGTLDNPKVNVDMSKLIRYQINKRINSFFGVR